MGEKLTFYKCYSSACASTNWYENKQEAEIEYLNSGGDINEMQVMYFSMDAHIREKAKELEQMTMPVGTRRLNRMEF